MQYTVRNRRRLRPTGEHVRATAAHPPEQATLATAEPAKIAEGSGPHRRLLVTEINLTRPFQGRLR